VQKVGALLGSKALTKPLMIPLGPPIKTGLLNSDDLNLPKTSKLAGYTGTEVAQAPTASSLIGGYHRDRLY
jgi:hypothetical protein